jgi:hypothetical protein
MISEGAKEVLDALKRCPKAMRFLGCALSVVAIWVWWLFVSLRAICLSWLNY